MRKAFGKEVLRSISQSAGRFIAIAVISFLGAGFFGGLRMSAPDMRLAGDEFFDGTNFYDLAVTTTMGVDDAVMRELRAIDGVDEVMGAYSADAMVTWNDLSYVASFESLPLEAARDSDCADGVRVSSGDSAYLNRPVLVQGAWPSGDGECVIGEDAAKEIGIGIGDEIEITQATSSLDETFAETRFKVTGFVLSPAFICSSMLGTTSLGSGQVDLFAYVGEGAFAKELPQSRVYLTVAGARDARWGTAAYDEIVDPVKQRLVDYAPVVAEQRRQDVLDDLHYSIVGAFQEMASSLDWADDIETPDVFVMDRSKNAGVASLESDADGIAQIASLFPLMFFLVAALVALTSMTRMVDEERMGIGTHKALGYGRAHIASKYLVYGALAGGVGAVAGVVVLGKLLPWFIMSSYAVMYAIPVIPLPLDPVISSKAIGLTVGITLVATGAAVLSTLRENPAVLMQPRAPKAGKRIFLERISPLWNRMSFSQKVAARNLLRYKRRFFMVVAGVAGCTALLVVGFGLRDAIGGIVENQFVRIVDYDVAVRLDDKVTYDERMHVVDELAESGVEGYLPVADFNMIGSGADGSDMRIEMVVPSDPGRLSDYVTLRNRESGEALAPGEAGIVLTEKAADVLGVGVGNAVEFYDENLVGDATGEARSFSVDGIAENYLGHYAYLTPEGYEKAFDEKPAYTLYFVKLSDSANRAAFGERMLACDGVATVSFVADRIATYEDMLDIMNKLIIVVVLAAAALAFVVIYNLTNINISERVREIATLKVLGFTRREVSVYIFREIFVMTAIGALLGCVLGAPLTLYIARAAETAVMMFGRTIEPFSFVISFALTVLFGLLVALAMRRKLVQVDMVESLKSVD